MKASPSVPPLASQQMDGPLPSSAATHGAQDAKIEAPCNEFQIINAVPLRMVPPPDQKPKRGKGPRIPLIDGRNIGLPEGWMFEQRQRTNPNYKGKFDQFYYEPGTNKQFRSIKEVEKYLQSKGQTIQQITTTQALQETDQQKLELPPVVDLPNDSGTNEPKKRKRNQQKRETPPVMDPTNNLMDAAARSSNPESSNKSNKEKGKRKKAATKQINFDFKSPPTEITWCLADAKSDEWTSYMGHMKVPDELEQYWVNAFKQINSPENRDYNK